MLRKYIVLYLVAANALVQHQEAVLDEDTFSLLQVNMTHIDPDPPGLAQTVGLSQQVANIHAIMKSNPEAGCGAMYKLLSDSRMPGPPTGAFGARLTQVEALDAGIGELAAEGILTALGHEAASAHSLSSGEYIPPPNAARICYAAVSSMGVQYDHERSLALYTHSPNLWKAMVAWTRRTQRDHDELRTAVMMFAGLYGVPPSDQALKDLNDAGGYDVMFDALDKNSTDLVVAQAAWAGLSDNIENSRFGAMLVANHGGTSKGVQFLVNILKQYRGKHAYQPGMHFGLRYESIHDINGILFWDDPENRWLNAAQAAGFMEEVIITMKDEPNDQLTQDNCCQALSLMSFNDATTQQQLEDAGAIELMVTAIGNNNYEYQDTKNYRHLNSCSKGLMALGKRGNKNLDKMLRLGLVDTLEKIMPAWAMIPRQREPWASVFPWSNVEGLRDMLETRRSTMEFYWLT